MAVVVPEGTFHFGIKSYRTKYPWNEWLDGQIRLLIRGEDWPEHLTATQFKNQAYHGAKACGLKVRINTYDERITYLQAYMPESQ